MNGTSTHLVEFNMARLIAPGHQPTLQDALDRLQHLQNNGDSDHAFGWNYLEGAQLWRTQKNLVAVE